MQGAELRLEAPGSPLRHFPPVLAGASVSALAGPQDLPSSDLPQPEILSLLSLHESATENLGWREADASLRPVLFQGWGWGGVGWCPHVTLATGHQGWWEPAGQAVC